MMMTNRSITKTLYSSMMQSMNMIGEEYVPPTATTLNDLFDIPNIVSDDNFKLGHFTIGISPVGIIVDDTIISRNYVHNPYDAMVWIKIPLFMKPLSEELTADEKTKYKLWTTETYEQTSYNVAYAKSFSTVSGSSDPIFIEYSEDTGFAESLDTLETLNPLIPTIPSETMDMLHTSNYVGFSTTMNASLTAEEVSAIRGYIDIIYPNRSGGNVHNLFELGVIMSKHDGRNSSDELVDAQISHFIELSTSDMVGDDLTISIDIGDLMPIISMGS